MNTLETCLFKVAHLSSMYNVLLASLMVFGCIWTRSLN